MLNIFLVIFENFKHLKKFKYLYFFHSVLNSAIQSPLSCSKELITPFGTSVKSKKGGFGGKNIKF